MPDKTKESQEDGAAGINVGLESLKGLIAKLTQAILGFAGTIIFARILGPTSFGGFYFLLSIVILTTRPVGGFGEALRKRYSETGANRKEIFGIIGVFIGVALIILAIGLIKFGYLLSRETNVENATIVFALLFVSLSVFLPLQSLVGASGNPAAQIWNDTLRSVLTFPFQLTFVLMGFGAAGMGYGLAGATFLTIPVAVWLLNIRPRLPSRETLLSVWDFARYSVPSTLVGTAYGRFDVLVLGAFLTTGIVGQYEVAYKLTVPATHMTAAVTGALMPKLSNLHSQRSDVGKHITNSLSYNSILSIPLFFGALSLAEPVVVTIYGSEYSEAAMFLIGLALYQVVSTQTAIYQTTLSAIDRPDVDLQIDVLTLLFNIVIGIGLLLTVGAIGVVIATVIAETARLGLSAKAVQQRVPDINMTPRPLGEQIVAAFLMYGLVRGVRVFVSIRSWLDLSLLVGFGICVYFFSLLLISRHARRTIQGIYRDAVV